MQGKTPHHMPDADTALNLALVVLLWVFILLWISPLASFADVPLQPNIAPGEIVRFATNN
jgi:hypothetical protein